MTIELIGGFAYEYRDEGIIIGQPAEGTVISALQTAKLISEADSHFGGSYGLIANRVNAYSVDFECYDLLDRAENLKAFAVVLHRQSSLQISAAEARNLRHTPFATFQDLDSALEWVREELSGD